jgi:hypothetical protein
MTIVSIGGVELKLVVTVMVPERGANETVVSCKTKLAAEVLIPAI